MLSVLQILIFTSCLSNIVRSYGLIPTPHFLKDCTRFVSKHVTAAIFISTLYTSPMGRILSAEAQVPTFDEYNLGSGSVIRPSKTNTNNAISADSIDYISMSSEDFIRNLQNLAAELKKDVTDKRWDKINVLYKQLKILKSPIFGMGGPQSLAKTFGINARDADTINSLREELLVYVNEVSETAVKEVVYFFNSEDLKQIELLKVESGLSDTGDSNIKSSCDEITEIVNKISQIIS